jgi:predicted flap endonuclease-1-like 5' DNA nuclease
MRLDYTLYVLAALFFLITTLALITPMIIETETRNLWVVTTAVLGILSIGLGYSQRPKTAAQACQPATTVETHKEEKTETPMEKPAMKEVPTVATAAVTTMELTQVKGIGRKRALQLKASGIHSVDDLSKASAKTVAKNLKISSKIVKKWIASAKELVK